MIGLLYYPTWTEERLVYVIEITDSVIRAFDPINNREWAKTPIDDPWDCPLITDMFEEESSNGALEESDIFQEDT